MIDNVISAYEAVKMNGVSQGIIALCSFIAVIIVIQKFVTAWKEAFSEGDKPVDMKQFFKAVLYLLFMCSPLSWSHRSLYDCGNGSGDIQNRTVP